jgi:hypothetical protein
MRHQSGRTQHEVARIVADARAAIDDELYPLADLARLLVIRKPIRPRSAVTMGIRCYVCDTSKTGGA